MATLGYRSCQPPTLGHARPSTDCRPIDFRPLRHRPRSMRAAPGPRFAATLRQCDCGRQLGGRQAVSIASTGACWGCGITESSSWMITTGQCAWRSRPELTEPSPAGPGHRPHFRDNPTTISTASLDIDNVGTAAAGTISLWTVGGPARSEACSTAGRRRSGGARDLRIAARPAGGGTAPARWLLPATCTSVRGFSLRIPRAAHRTATCGRWDRRSGNSQSGAR